MFLNYHFNPPMPTEKKIPNRRKPHFQREVEKRFCEKIGGEYVWKSWATPEKVAELIVSDLLLEMAEEYRQQGYEAGRKEERKRVKEIIKNEVKIEKSAPPANELEKTAEWYLISGFGRILS